VFAALTLGVWRLDVSRQAIGEARADAVWTVKVKIQKAEAVLLLDSERKKVAIGEQNLRNFKDKQEIQDGKNRTKVVGLEHRLRAAEYNLKSTGEQFAMMYDDQVNATTTWIDWQADIKDRIPKT